ncbi:PSD1 domain-containing protein [Telmatocola sphagniphila]|uniref:PSD1 domain-containing protein n=2 Tax=Telmatocola sphagniphila TaxID=1123043 RepID=A0A8E6BCV8_9BACT|nr:PSD1 domain-containing protein [Telmatocola sphagniphila]
MAFSFLIGNSTARAETPVDYNRDIRPILASACYACHGPDENQRKAKLRLDVREAALKKAIHPGKADESLLIQRITTKDADEVMPPPQSKKPAVTAEQLKLLRRWIEEGAKFEEHWAYVKPVPPAIPTIPEAAWVRNPVDAFVASELVKQKMRHSPTADKSTLLRRLSLDLTGLPPTPAEVDSFLSDNSASAYEKVVDRLLASPHFGERMAVMWLDVVRYADTCGYHSDNHRDIWMFRDYVINSFNANKPFDRFTIEEIAGDLLPNPNNETKVASGYNRMLMTTEEGGAQAKEYTAKYAADRVRNTSNAWLGATLGCAECHNHKYDPYTSKDFYRFAAFFSDIREHAVGRQEQTRLGTSEQEAQLKKWENEIAQLEASWKKPSVERDAEQLKWEAELAGKKEGTKGFPGPVIEALKITADKRNPGQKEAISVYFRSQIAKSTSKEREQLARLKTQRDQLVNSIPTTLVSISTSPRMTRILPRGNWQDDSGDPVQPDVPAFLGSVAPKDAKARATRLDLAKWLASPENPLTARVYVNRLWKIAFGQGLVRNLDDLGMQGTPPSHPALLDWLTIEFIKRGWSTKDILKLMVMSNTYRQSSVATAEMMEKDPSNIWLARQSRFRVDAEFVRDNALAVSGLLNQKIGGPSAKPYQPAGFWSYLNFPVREWQNDQGENQYRRGVYTYWCRSFLHPSLFAFDAPTREECTNERSRSSTPLQALVLLNDPTYVEASRVLAQQVIQKTGTSEPQKISWLFKQVLSRKPSEDEEVVLSKLHAKHLREYQSDKEAAVKILSVGLYPKPKEFDTAQLAAWTSVCRVLLNLHETLTRN